MKCARCFHLLILIGLMFLLPVRVRGDSKQHVNGIGMKLVEIPSGSFWMGSPEGEPYRTNGELRHQVTLTCDFRMGAYEVTQAQWQRVMGESMKDVYARREKESQATRAKEAEKKKAIGKEAWAALVKKKKYPDGPRQAPAKRKLSAQEKKDAGVTRKEINELKETYKKLKKEGRHIGYGDNHPMAFVSWTEAVAFCRKLTEVEKASGHLQEGWSYRLPTEAEWEYACRAGSQTPVYTGAQPVTTDRASIEAFKKVAWSNTNSANMTHEVGQLAPNPWGLYDIYGNVSEWCLDIYAPYTSETFTDPLVLEGPHMMRVSRGLNSHCTMTGFRSATRKTGGPRMPFYAFFGFRVVCAPVTDKTASVPDNHTNR